MRERKSEGASELGVCVCVCESIQTHRHTDTHRHTHRHTHTHTHTKGWLLGEATLTDGFFSLTQLGTVVTNPKLNKMVPRTPAYNPHRE